MQEEHKNTKNNKNHPQNPLQSLKKRSLHCETCHTNRAQLQRPKTSERLCQDCFFQAIESEILHTLQSQLPSLSSPTSRNIKIGIGCSGGKDSTFLLHVLHTLAEKHDLNISFIMLSIDEGIKGYRDFSLQCVSRNSQVYGVPLNVLSFKELYTYSMDQIAQIVGIESTCTYCGVFRRQALDRAAAKSGCEVICTGHNADDLAETFFMNLMRGDAKRILKTQDSQK